MAIIAGVDGCKDGWLVVFQDLVTGTVDARILSRIDEILLQSPLPEVLAIDIPIGLPEAGMRRCDSEARTFLGSPRSSSVFTAPIRPVMNAENHAEANAIWRTVEGKGCSKQTFAIVPKIREVDDFLRGDVTRRGWMREIHPEVSFAVWNNARPIVPGKRSSDGAQIRKELVESVYGVAHLGVAAKFKGAQFGMDDVLDAFAALWSAGRIHRRESRELSAVKEFDAFGLRMEIWA